MTLRVFVSSTCHDLRDLRSTMKEVLLSLGCEPVLSDHQDTFRVKTGLSSYNECLEAARSADLFILIIGSRYGGVVADAGRSITELEYEAASSAGIRRLTFCRDAVWLTNHLFQLNPKMVFPKEYDNGPALMRFIDRVRTVGEGKTDNWVSTFRDGSDLKGLVRSAVASVSASLPRRRRSSKVVCGNIVLPKVGFESFPRPFVQDGVLSALFIVGDSYEHGEPKRNAHASDALLVSQLVMEFRSEAKVVHFAKFDTWATDREKKESNLIVIGGPNINGLIRDLNENGQLPIYYDLVEDSLVSRVSGTKYRQRQHGAVQIVRNPFNPQRCALVCLGHSGPGTVAAVLACRELWRHELVRNNRIDDRIPARVVCGKDTDNDQWIDDVEFVE